MERFMVELFVRGAALCLLIALALLLLGRAAAGYRHLLCVVALCGLLALPLAQRILPPLLLPTPQPMAIPARATVPTLGPDNRSVTASKPEITSLLKTPQEHVDRTSSMPSQASDSIVQEPDRIRPVFPLVCSRIATIAVLSSIWGLGVAILLIRLMVALVRLHRLETESRQLILGGVVVRVGERVATPLTWGIRRQVILLPAALVSGSPEVCESAIRHEQAHIVRKDWIWNLLAEVVCAFCWFQPGAWWLRRRMRLESERACDDLALLSGIAGPDYAAHLLEILRSNGKGEVAPAMAQSGGMEERMRHILDAKKPRRANRLGLALAAPFGFALLSLAALRVTARPAEAKLLSPRASAVLISRGPGMALQPSNSRLPAAASGAPQSMQLPDPDLPLLSVNRTVPSAPRSGPLALALPGTEQRNSAPATTPGADAAFPVGRVVWGKAMDGLEPGFLLTAPGFTSNGGSLERAGRVPSNSQVSYRVLVRNTTDRDHIFEMRCLNTDGMDIPYLVPGEEIPAALEGRELLKQFRAEWTSSPLTGLFPAYVVKLAPGETVVVPGEFGLYVGDAQKQVFPRIEKIKPGRNWIVQPITIHSLTVAEAERAMATESNGTQSVTAANREGKARKRSVTTVPARDGGTKLYATLPLEVGALDAAAGRKSAGGQTPSGGGAPSTSPAVTVTMLRGNALEPAAAASQEPDGIAWGPGREVQAGVRSRLWAAPQHMARFVFDVYLRNRTKRTLTVTCPSRADLSVASDAPYWTAIQSDPIYCAPHLRDTGGSPVDIVFKLAEKDSQIAISPGQAVRISHWMLRTMDRTTKASHKEILTQVAFVESGRHRMSCDVSASWGGKGGRRMMLRTGETAFDVTAVDVREE